MKPSTEKTLISMLCFSMLTISNVSCAKENETADAISAPITQGEEAHKNHCYKCHSDDVYTRENRFVKSLDALSKQVVRCKDSNNVPWFDEDTDAVVQFLNKKYYRF